MTSFATKWCVNVVIFRFCQLFKKISSSGPASGTELFPAYHHRYGVSRYLILHLNGHFRFSKFSILSITVSYTYLWFSHHSRLLCSSDKISFEQSTPFFVLYMLLGKLNPHDMHILNVLKGNKTQTPNVIKYIAWNYNENRE